MDDRIEILSDTLILDMAGVMIGLSPKTILLPGLRAAVTVRGETIPVSNFMAEYVIPNMCAEMDFDDAIDKLRLALLKSRRACPLPPTSLFLISGWGKRFGFRNFAVATGDNDFGMAPMVLQELEDLWISGNGEELAAGLSYQSLECGLENVGHRFFQAFRKPADMPNYPGTAATTVGGQLLLTTITEAEITQRVVGYWPDFLGKRADPERRFVPVL